MESSDPQQTKVDFYEAEYDKAYEEKSSFNVYKPIIAGWILIIPAVIFLLTGIYAIFLEYDGWGYLLLWIIISILQITVIYAGYCAIKKQRHRFTLVGAFLTFITPFNFGIIFADISGAFWESFYVIGRIGFPLFALYLLFTSDDEFSS